jgi:prepilin-type N-terminal cleavage/methylation domain-containing protein
MSFAPAGLVNGFTVLELLAVITVIAILAALAVPVGSNLLDRFESASCMNNMRNLIPPLSAYVQERGHWPQEPQSAKLNDKAHEDWWINELQPYDLTEKNWQCPTIRRKVTSKSEDRRPRLHYSPTLFDDKPGTPFRWATQPWFIEIGNAHGRGAFICFPDGSIKTINDFL